MTRPAVPPYSSITTAMWNLSCCISRSSSATRFCSGTNTAGRTSSRRVPLAPPFSLVRRTMSFR